MSSSPSGRTVCLLAALIALAVPQSGQADLFQFNVSLDGSQEVPANGSLGTGTATVLFDNVSGLMTVNGSFSGLTAPVSVAHVHGFAPAGVNAGVQFALTPSGGTSGTLSGAGFIGPGDFANVLAGLTYINVHTSAFPGGEIRGQIANPIAVPEPTFAGILGLGAACVWLRRKK